MKKFLKYLMVTVGSVVGLFVAFVVYLMLSVDADFDENGLPVSMSQQQKDSTMLVRYSGIIHEVENDAWSASYLLNMNNKRPSDLAGKTAKPIIVSGVLLGKSNVVSYFGVDEQRNMTIEFKNNDDFHKLKSGQRLTVRGNFIGGSLPKFENAEVIDTVEINQKIKQLRAGA